jgi:hypothetical protein
MNENGQQIIIRFLDQADEYFRFSSEHLDDEEAFQLLCDLRSARPWIEYAMKSAKLFEQFLNRPLIQEAA